ncbi:hypothetical protein ES288_D06G243400v1 [Gossypium darwinii]|uniref:Leucine-rich repeat-containing N-terminal plant-type domain-containing protein n=1 Tax=Gossypium darwinii TaxID=34276 RepID=A0A5D2CBS2_GOSDA|nr:hypothetical protein ES288_D06G243400v1 [Gossypium darwinii]
MESKGLTMVLIVLSLGAGLCDGCLEDERLALFQLKPFFHFIDHRVQYLNYDDSVEEKESSSDCCEWERVVCNPTSGRITHLSLDVPYVETSYDLVDIVEYNYMGSQEENYWYLNASLFLPFEELQNLSLRGNSVAGCIVNQGFERFSSRLNKLEILDLSENYFNNSILTSLSGLSSLNSLNLANNKFTGSNSTYGIKILSKLNNLESLDLSFNNLGNNILQQLNGFTSLKSLRLQNCGLKRIVDMYWNPPLF